MTLWFSLTKIFSLVQVIAFTSHHTQTEAKLSFISIDCYDKLCKVAVYFKMFDWTFDYNSCFIWNYNSFFLCKQDEVRKRKLIYCYITLKNLFLFHWKCWKIFHIALLAKCLYSYIIKETLELLGHRLLLKSKFENSSASFSLPYSALTSIRKFTPIAIRIAQ